MSVCKPNLLVYGTVFVISLTFVANCEAQHKEKREAQRREKREKVVFTKPRRGDTIQHRRNFEVALEIDGIKKSRGYHWVAIASITGYDKTWERVLELYRKKESGKATDRERSEMLKLISAWEIDLFWPKFYILTSPHTGRVFDGGQNPFQGIEPQPMVLLTLKVDSRLQNYFKTWFKNGAAGKGYPGIPVSMLGKDMVLGRREIFFP